MYLITQNFLDPPLLLVVYPSAHDEDCIDCVQDTYPKILYDDDDEKAFWVSRDFKTNDDDDDEYDNTINGYTHACHAHWSSWIRYVKKLRFF